MEKVITITYKTHSWTDTRTKEPEVITVSYENCCELRRKVQLEVQKRTGYVFYARAYIKYDNGVGVEVRGY